MSTQVCTAPEFANATVLVLAAGRGTRFSASGGQGHKLQASLCGGPTVLQHVLATVAQAGMQAHVVLPSGQATAGMGDSIAHGVRATRSAAAWLILPGDMPLVQPSTLRAVLNYLLQHPACAAVQPLWQGQAGHPVAFAAHCAPALQALQGDQGARSVLQTLQGQGLLARLPTEDPGVVLDIDCVADLARAESWLATSRLPARQGMGLFARPLET